MRTYNKVLQVPLSSGMRDSTAKGDRMVYIHFALLFACIIYAAIPFGFLMAGLVF